MKKILLLFCFVCIIIFLFMQNNYIEISKYKIGTTKIEENLRIVQLSDLHNKVFKKEQRKLVGKVRNLQPDIIVLTGDMIDERKGTKKEQFSACLDLVDGLRDYPIYYIAGNHESVYDWYEELKKELEMREVIILENQSIEYDETITITGTDDLIYQKGREGRKQIKKLNTDIDSTKFNILLNHRPEHSEKFSINEDKEGYDLLISGHAHGGQIRIPFLLENGLYSPSEKWLPKLTSGIKKIDESFLVISRGLGNSRFPLRVFNYPEIVVIDIEKE